MAVKAKQVSELETQAEYLQRTAPEKMDEIQVKKTQVEMRFEQLKAPLLDRQRQLEKKKEAFQVSSHPLFTLLVLQFCLQFVVFGVLTAWISALQREMLPPNIGLKVRLHSVAAQETPVCVCVCVFIYICCFVSQKSGRLFLFQWFFFLNGQM